LKSLSTDGKYITLGQLAKHRKNRERDTFQRSLKPEFGFKEQTLAYLEAALLYLEFQDETGNMPIAWLDMFFVQEKLPFEFGWKIRPVSSAKTIETALSIKMKALFS
jgi:hypothetical protein